MNRRRRPRNQPPPFAAIALGVLLLMSCMACRPAVETPDIPDPAADAPPTYVGRTECAECHAAQSDSVGGESQAYADAVMNPPLQPHSVMVE